MKTLIITIALSLIASFSFSQDWRLFPSKSDSTSEAINTTPVTGIKKAEQPGKITIKKDDRIDALSEELGKPTDGVSVKISGYRLQVIASSKKAAVDAERAKAASRDNKVKTYVDYRQPNFRLRLGDFTTKLEAQKLQYELKDLFPSAIVVTDFINLPEL